MAEKTDLNCPDINFIGQIDGNLEWMNTKDAANFLRVSPAFLTNLVSNGKVPYYKFGRSNRFKRIELIKLLESEPRGLRND